MRTENGPDAGGVPRSFVSELPAGGDWGSPVDVLAPGYELGCLFAALFLDLLQALIFSLCIADGFGQHLAQLSLGLRGFSLG
jgi:hypothetical protein